MEIERDRVDAVIQYALAVACRVHADDWMLRDLGPIHLLKYVYLADIAYAKRNRSSFTGTTWTFHHFGPWAPAVLDRIPVAAHAIGAEEKRIASRYRDDFIRWQLRDPEDADEVFNRLGRTLPLDVALAVRQAVKEFGNDTPSLLDFVYRTGPMVHAAPGERIDLSSAKTEPPKPVPAPSVETTAALSPKAMKKRQEILAEARARFHEAAQQRLRDRAASRTLQPEPRYDEVFEDGVKYLDELAGPALAGRSGVLEFSEAVWRSPIRRGGGTDEDG